MEPSSSSRPCCECLFEVERLVNIMLVSHEELAEKVDDLRQLIVRGQNVALLAAGSLMAPTLEVGERRG